MSILEAVRGAITDYLAIPSGLITEDTDLRMDIHLPPEDLGGAVRSLEVQYGIRIPEEEVLSFHRVKDMVSCVEKHLYNGNGLDREG
ncbi:MAG: hypothetical protein II781_03450 [Clostridia bacterium]|nr:hypothetical protein [Clostridia bacterium]